MRSVRCCHGRPNGREPVGRMRNWLLQDVHGARDDHDREQEADAADSTIISSFAHRLNGIVSVGLNAVAFVKRGRGSRRTPAASAAGANSSVCCGNRKSGAWRGPRRRASGPPPSSCQNQSPKTSTFVIHMWIAGPQEEARVGCAPSHELCTSRMIAAAFATADQRDHAVERSDPAQLQAQRPRCAGQRRERARCAAR